MKLQIIWFVSSFLFIQNVISQDSLQTRKPEQHKPVYSARIYLPGTQNFTANLMDIKDSSIFTWQKKTSSPDPFHKHSMSMFDEAGWEKYDYKVIQSVKIRKKTLRAILIYQDGQSEPISNRTDLKMRANLYCWHFFLALQAL